MTSSTNHNHTTLLAVLIILGALLLLAVLGIPMLLIAVKAAREQQELERVTRNLEQIGQALHNYHQKQAPLPPPELANFDLPGPADSPIDAATQLTAALEEAKASDKRVLVHLVAPWCGWCKKLEQFLQTNAALFADDYVILKIDVEEMENGEEVGRKLRGDRTIGLPWIAILDPDGTELVSSDGPQGNIGCPVTVEECAHFVSMIEKTIQHAPDNRVAEIAQALENFAAERR